MIDRSDCSTATNSSNIWLRAGGTYLGISIFGHLLWETLQLPLYTIWTIGTPREQAFAVTHCTLGDVLIALSTLTLAMAIAGRGRWPREHFWLVAGIAMSLGVAYTAFSEWLNVVIRASWAYSEWMPVISLFGLSIGLSPLLQWIAVPCAAFLITRSAVDRLRRR